MTARREHRIHGLPDALRALREAKGLSQVQAARLLGVTPAAYHRVEAGRTEISVGQMCCLAEAWGVSLDALLLPLYRDRKDSAGLARTGTPSSSSRARKSSRDRTTR